MKITMKEPGKLKPHPKNSRTHSPEQIEQLVVSIKKFGFTKPILVDGSDQIIAGHGATQAAIKAGLKKIPTVEMGNLSEPEIRAYMIADNSLAQNSTWDYDILKTEMTELQLADIDLNIMGFADLDSILSGWDSTITIPDPETGEALFKIRVKGNEVDKEDVVNVLTKAINESGIEGVEIA